MARKRKPSRESKDLALVVARNWSQSVESLELTIGRIKEIAIATHGGKMKPNGIAPGKINFPLIGRKSIIETIAARNTEQT